MVVVAAAVLFIQKAGFSGLECYSDSDCVPATCCHPDSCVSYQKAPECSGMMCTEECKPNTLDCNQGSCLCQKGKCLAKLSNITSSIQ